MSSVLSDGFQKIDFVGNVDECISCCEKKHKRFVEIRIFCILGMVGGVCVWWLFAWTGSIKIMVSGIILTVFCFLVFPFKKQEPSIVKTSETEFNVFQAVKNNKIKGIVFRNIEEQESFCNIIFYLEDVKGNIETATVSSVHILKNTNPKYDDLIEINLDRKFEITHSFYSNLPYNTIFK